MRKDRMLPISGAMATVTLAAIAASVFVIVLMTVITGFSKLDAV